MTPDPFATDAQREAWETLRKRPRPVHLREGKRHGGWAVADQFSPYPHG